ncbi:MAG: AraC family transcriptional regulator [Bacteroidota bacterium]
MTIGQNTVEKRSDSIAKTIQDTSKNTKPTLAQLEVALQKAKQTENITEIANAYFDYTEFFLKPLQETGIKYCDSILLITKDLENNEKYPALAYKQKGRYYYRIGKYKLALDNFTTALATAKENTLLYETTNFNIGLIKNTIERREEAKQIFKQYVQFLETKQNKLPAKNYNRALFALSHTLTYTGEMDTAVAYIEKGMKNSIATNDTTSYNYFVLNSGINSYFKKEYKAALDSLLRARALFINDTSKRTSLAYTYLYLGKNNIAMNKSGIAYFASVDSILEITKEDVTLELLEAYDYLKKHYEAKGDPQKRLEYAEQEIKFRNIFLAEYQDLVKNIVTNYDNKILEKERDKIISEIKEKGNIIIIVLLSLLLAFGGAIYYFFRKQVIHKKRFLKLLAEQEQKAAHEEKAGNQLTNSLNNTIKELPEELVNDILGKLTKFEATDKFVKKKYTLPQLAKELNTNGTYLSKVINEVKQVNFANYLNQLRIDYAVARITNDTRFREYTIKAIAEECGFKTQQSFSAAFYKKTGIKPSFFIRQLKNKIKNSNN